MRGGLRNSPAIGVNDVLVGDQDSATLYALSKEGGSLVWKTVLDPTLGAIVTSSPIVADGRVYVGVSSNQEVLPAVVPGFPLTFRGSVVALDETTGRILWQSYMLPIGYTGGSVWSSTIAIDSARSALYVTTGNNYAVPASVLTCQADAATPAQQDSCLSPDNHIDSVLSLNMASGAVNWSQRLTHADVWLLSCLSSLVPTPATPCPTPTGADSDFGSGANLFTITSNGQSLDVVGAGQKSGVYTTMNRDTGAIVWGTQVGPGGPSGGIQLGTATDEQRIYVPESNSNHDETTLIPSGQKTNGGFWSALDKNTGQILWQTPSLGQAVAPAGKVPFTAPPPPGALSIVAGSVSIANGIMYGEDIAGNFVLLDAAQGHSVLP